MAESFTFTERSVEALQPPTAGQVDYRDAKTPGLYLRITSAGARTFSFIARAKGKGTVARVTIGRHPAVRVQEAQRRALEIAYEYVRRGTCNLFVAVEPAAGKRTVAVTERRAKTDFVAFVRHLINNVYRSARCIHLVLDNLNIHMRKSFEDVLGKPAASRLLNHERPEPRSTSRRTHCI